MGWNTTVVVMNDALGYIEEDPEFGKNLVRAILGLNIPADKRKRDVAARKPGGGVYVNAATVIEHHDNDTVVTIDVGGNTAVVVAHRYDPKFPGPADRETHECYACGREHAGFEEKYCDVCGKAAQERRTLYEALHIIEMCTRKGDLEGARDYALQALVVAPWGERLDVTGLDWKAVLDGRMTREEAYEQLEAQYKKGGDAAQRNKKRDRSERWDRQRKKADQESK